jgi:hypothetical protein
MKQPIGFFIVMAACFWVAQKAPGQPAKILKSNGNAAVISAGANKGIHVGNFMTVYRQVNTGWRPMTYVQVTRTNGRLSRISLVPIAPQVKLLAGDRVLPSKAAGQASLSPSTNGSVPLFQRNHRAGRVKGVYLGPSIGIFTPIAEMEKIFKNTYSYGGILGVQFRPDLDVSARFLFTVHENDWSLWNIQLLGRRYSQDGFLFDFGYGVLYPQIWEGGFISLGFCGGLGYTFPVAYDTWCEFGFIYSYYPHFIKDTAQFLNIELRLIY